MVDPTSLQRGGTNVPSYPPLAQTWNRKGPEPLGAGENHASGDITVYAEDTRLICTPVPRPT